VKAVIRFIRTTFVGGMLFLVPFAALAIILGKALALAHKVGDPLAAHLPPEVGFGLKMPLLLDVGVLIIFSFLAGIFARTVLAGMIIKQLEATVLSKVPGYALLKSTGASMLGVESVSAYPVVLVRLGDSQHLGLRTDVLASGRVVVFIPSTPDPQTGEVHLVAADQVQLTGLPLATAMQLLKNYGAGAGALLRDQPQGDLLAK
jgi:uncharacterized membrane protein